MNEKTKRNIVFLFLVLVISYLLIRQIFKAMELSLVDYPKFQYKGKMPKKDWYAYITPLAKAVGNEYGIPWQAIAVQTAIETGWGKSSLLRKYNNFAGIKATKGELSVNLQTVEYINGNRVEIKDGFKVWATPYEGLKGYAEFIHRNKRYANALKYPKDPYQYIVEIKKAGYATDPNYVAKLHNLLNENFA